MQRLGRRGIVVHHGDADVVGAGIAAIGLIAREIFPRHDAHAGFAPKPQGHRFAAAVRRNVKRAAGTSGRARLTVFRSSKHIYAQLIDDAKGNTLAAASSIEKTLREGAKTGANIDAAKAVGKLIAERAKEKGIKDVVFDRGGYLYHGRIKALADAAREGGLNF